MLRFHSPSQGNKIERQLQRKLISKFVFNVLKGNLQGKKTFRNSIPIQIKFPRVL